MSCRHVFRRASPFPGLNPPPMFPHTALILPSYCPVPSQCPHSARTLPNTLPLPSPSLSQGYDEEYRDPHGRALGMPGFIPPCYDASYTDPYGKKPGQQGFVPPPHGLKRFKTDARLTPTVPLDLDGYDDNYRDFFGRKPGDHGFIPPSEAKLGKTPEQVMDTVHVRARDICGGRGRRTNGQISPRLT